jgi:putative addiction module component (TIGR02574 family)
MTTKLLTEILEMSVAERIQLVEDVWDSIAAVPEAVELSDEQRSELDRRLAEFHRSNEPGAPWNEVKARILARR